MWDIPSLFSKCTSKKPPDSEVAIKFENRDYTGWVTAAKQGRKSPAYRLWFGEELSFELKHKFLMSYMRSLEKGLRGKGAEDIEIQIPFWEFLDIEFDKKKKFFRFVAYYYQEPSFPELFKRLIASPAIQKIDDELESKSPKRIHKQGWKPREDLEYEIGAHNVIYTLIDTENNLLYVGEAKDLIRRLSQEYRSIPHWNYFRYCVLPEALNPFRVSLERMMIRDFAEILGNKGGVDGITISEYKLANEKIDTR